MTEKIPRTAVNQVSLDLVQERNQGTSNKQVELDPKIENEMNMAERSLMPTERTERIILNQTSSGPTDKQVKSDAVPAKKINNLTDTSSGPTDTHTTLQALLPTERNSSNMADQTSLPTDCNNSNMADQTSGPTDNQVDLDKVLYVAGFKGKYQMTQTLMIVLNVLSSALPILSIVFIGYVPDHQCAVLPNSTDFTKYGINETDIINIEYKQCSIDITTNNTRVNSLTQLQCIHGYKYSTPREISIVSEWDLVCERSGLAELSQTILMFGSGVGGLGFSSLADRFGRRKIHLLCHAIQFSASLGLAFINHITGFIILRFFIGCAQEAINLTGYAIFVELLVTEVRPYAGCIGGLSWTTSCMLLAPVGYLLQNSSWRVFQFFTTGCMTYVIFLVLFLDESLRWLLANNRLKEAEKIIKRICKLNKTDYNKTMAVLREQLRKSKTVDSVQPEHEHDVDQFPQKHNQDGDCFLQDTEETTKLLNHPNSKHEASLPITISSLDSNELNEQPSSDIKMKDNCNSPDLKDTFVYRDGNQSSYKNGSERKEEDVINDDRRHERHNNCDVNEIEQLLEQYEQTNNQNDDILDSNVINDITHCHYDGPKNTNSAAFVGSSHMSILQLPGTIGSSFVSVVDTTASVVKYTVMDIVKNLDILKLTLILVFVWVVNNVTYYGLFLTSSSLSGNRFVNYFLNAVVELPAMFGVFFALKRVGRKVVLATLLILSGSSLIISVSLLSTVGAGTSSLVFSLFGKFAITASFNCLFIYTPEIFPTNLRNAGLGTVSAASRFGGMVAPYSKLLGDLVIWGPGVVFGAGCMIAAFLMYFVPETRGQPLPTTIEELRSRRKSKMTDQIKVENKIKLSA